MNCRDLMTPVVRSCTEETPAAECAQIMRDGTVGFLPVLDRAGAVVGVITDRDLALRVLAERLPPGTPAAAIMTPGPFVSCSPDESVRLLERRMARTRRSRALVLEHSGALLGIISLSDIAQGETSGLRTARLLRDVTARESPAAGRR